MRAAIAALLEPVSTLAAWQQLVGILVAAILLAAAASVGWTAILRRRADARGGFSEILLAESRLPIFATVLFAAAYLSAGRFADLPFAVDRVSTLVANLSLSGIAVAWTYAGIRIGRLGLETARENGTRYAFAPMLKNIWSLVVVVLAFIALVGIWGVTLTPVLASAGVLGIVIGVAARDTIANFIGGISLFFDNTYKLGDYVHLESGEKGTVVDIGIRSTTLLTLDHVLVTVPNSVLNTAQVINQSAPDRQMRIRVDVRVPYDADLDVAERCMLDAAGAANSILETPEPKVRIQQYAERGIEYQLMCWVANPIRQVKGRHDVYRELHGRFRDEHIEVPFPGREITFADDEVPARSGRFADEQEPGP